MSFLIVEISKNLTCWVGFLISNHFLSNRVLLSVINLQNF